MVANLTRQSRSNAPDDPVIPYPFKSRSDRDNSEESGNSTDNHKKVIKKRKYSRAGCEECKRRKMKCDEGKPHCHNCSRLNKTCIYKPKQKYTFENGVSIAHSRNHSQVENQQQDSGTNNINNNNGISALAAGASALNSFSSPPQSDHRLSVPSLHSPNSVANVPSHNNLHVAHSPPQHSPNTQGANSNGNSVDSFSLRHYMPVNGGYINNFVTELALANSASPNNSTYVTALRKSSFPRTESESQSFQISPPLTAQPRGHRLFDSAHTTRLSQIKQESAQPLNINASGEDISQQLSVSDSNQKLGQPQLHTQKQLQTLGQSPSRSFTNAISDILTPTESNEYILNQTDFLEMKHLFDEASLLVSDMNDLQAFDLLNFNSNYDSSQNNLHSRQAIDNTLANPLVERRLRELSNSPNYNDNKIHNPDSNISQLHQNSQYHDLKPRTSSMNSTAAPHGHSESISGSDSGIKSVSDSYEKHNFRVDEFSKGITGDVHNNLMAKHDQVIDEYDVNTPVHVSYSQNADNNDGSVPSNSELIEAIIRQHSLSGPHANYLRYLNDESVSSVLYPFASSIEHNEVVNILLRYSNNCPYLLSALLAMITTIQFNMTGKPIHEISGQKYVSVCLKSLSQAFVNNSPNKVNQFLNDIERLLLTVIILTSFFSSKTFRDKDNVLNSWKTHLRGAKDLLINYSLTTKNQSRLNVSSGLALARTWFFAIEALASVTTPLGGTLTRIRNKDNQASKTSSSSKGTKEDTRDESANQRNTTRFERSQSVGAMSIDTEDTLNDSNHRVFADTGYFDKEHNPEYHDALLNNGLLTSVDPNFNISAYNIRSSFDYKVSEFNLFLGFTMELVYLIQEFAKSLEFLRSMSTEQKGKQVQLSSLRIAKLTSLIHNAQMAVIAPLVNLKTFVIPDTSPAHPQFPKLDPDKISLPESAYGKFKTSDGDYTHYSWFDVSQQCHCDAIYLRLLLTPGMLQVSKDHVLVKELVARIFNCLFFILPKTEEYVTLRKDKIIAETKNYFISSDLFDHRSFMIQSPYRLVTPLVDDEESFEKLELFFTGLVKLGNGSATGGLDTLNKRREYVKKRANSNDKGRAQEDDNSSRLDCGEEDGIQGKSEQDESDDREGMSLAQTEIVPFS